MNPRVILMFANNDNKLGMNRRAHENTLQYLKFTFIYLRSSGLQQIAVYLTNAEHLWLFAAEEAVKLQAHALFIFILLIRTFYITFRPNVFAHLELVEICRVFGLFGREKKVGCNLVG